MFFKVFSTEIESLHGSFGDLVVVSVSQRLCTWCWRQSTKHCISLNHLLHRLLWRKRMWAGEGASFVCVNRWQLCSLLSPRLEPLTRCFQYLVMRLRGTFWQNKLTLWAKNVRNPLHNPLEAFFSNHERLQSSHEKQLLRLLLLSPSSRPPSPPLPPLKPRLSQVIRRSKDGG